MNRILKLVSRIINRNQLIMKKLAVFDFDHTIINDNSDTAVLELAVSDLSEDVRQLYKEEGWTAYMQAIFKVLHQDKISEPQIANFIKNLPSVCGMEQLITELCDRLNYDVIIVSDSNTFFIETWLKSRKLDSKVLKVFTNPAAFDCSGLLVIQMYHFQESCSLSTKNLCKGMIVDDFVANQSKNGIIYDQLIYVGDGYNDFCPILRLGENDIACVRDKFECVKLVNKAKDGNFVEKGVECSVKSKVCIWDSGHDILNFLKNASKDASK